MKKTSLALLSSILAINTLSADITGDYKGNLMGLDLIIHISGNPPGITLDSPMQGAAGIKSDKTEIKGDTVTFAISSLRLQYSGIHKNDTVSGTFSQNGASFPLSFVKMSKEKEIVAEGINEKEVTFNNKDIVLTGTITTPSSGGIKGGVVLISGSGTQDRDETFFNHKPFKKIAEYLSRDGWAVLRYDDRGAGGSSKATGLETSFDFADDASAAMDFLRSELFMKGKKAGWIGHSEGALIAMINAARNPESTDFLISMCGPGMAGRDLMPEQSRLLALSNGADSIAAQNIFDEAIKMYKPYFLDSPEKIKQEIIINVNTETKNSAAVDSMLQVLTSPWFITFMTTDPADYLKNIRCPLLAVGGEYDAQVSAGNNTSRIKEYAPQTDVVIIPKANHLLQITESFEGSSMYYDIKDNISDKALETFATWLDRNIR